MRPSIIKCSHRYWIQLWTSAPGFLLPVHRDSLSLLFQFWGQQFALWPQFSDRPMKSRWFSEVFFPSPGFFFLWRWKWQLPNSQHPLIREWKSYLFSIFRVFWGMWFCMKNKGSHVNWMDVLFLMKVAIISVCSEIAPHLGRKVIYQ